MFYNETCRNLPYPINLIHLSSILHIGIIDSDICGEDGFIMYKPERNKYKIVIDYSGKSFRKRFTLAHEIGHIILKHFEQFDVNSLTDTEKEILDIEANVFAGELLMPYVQIKSMNTDIEYMTNLFMVTSDAMETRLKFLGIKVEMPKQIVAERPIVNYCSVQLNDDELRQLNKSHDSWLYDF